MATTEKLDSILNSKNAIKKAITDKGVACDDVLSSYATTIEENLTPIHKIEIHTANLAVGMTFEVPYGKGGAFEIIGEQSSGAYFYTSFYTKGVSPAEELRIQDVGTPANWKGTWAYDWKTKKMTISITEQLS